MFYRTRIDLFFTDQTEALKAREKALAQLPNSFTINLGMENEERGYIVVEQCFHDEDPSRDCILIEKHQSPD